MCKQVLVSIILVLVLSLTPAVYGINEQTETFNGNFDLDWGTWGDGSFSSTHLQLSQPSHHQIEGAYLNSWDTIGSGGSWDNEVVWTNISATISSGGQGEWMNKMKIDRNGSDFRVGMYWNGTTARISGGMWDGDTNQWDGFPDVSLGSSLPSSVTLYIEFVDNGGGNWQVEFLYDTGSGKTSAGSLDQDDLDPTSGLDPTSQRFQAQLYIYNIDGSAGDFTTGYLDNWSIAAAGGGAGEDSVPPMSLCTTMLAYSTPWGRDANGVDDGRGWQGWQASISNPGYLIQEVPIKRQMWMEHHPDTAAYGDLYDLQDPNAIAVNLEMGNRMGLDAWVVWYWTPYDFGSSIHDETMEKWFDYIEGNNLDNKLCTIIDVAWFPVAVDIGIIPSWDRDTVVYWTEFVLEKYGDRTPHFKYNGRPVIWYWPVDLLNTSDWQYVLDKVREDGYDAMFWANTDCDLQVGSYYYDRNMTLLEIFDGGFTISCDPGFAGWSQYNQHDVYCAGITEGKARDAGWATMPRPGWLGYLWNEDVGYDRTPDGDNVAADWEDTLACGGSWALQHTWNEYYEMTQFEPALEYENVYIDVSRCYTDLIKQGGTGNTVPITRNDKYLITGSSISPNAASGVLANDLDLEGGAMTAVLIDDVTDGTLTLYSDGSFTYTKNANFVRSDSFTYKANDGSANSHYVGTVTLDVDCNGNGVPDWDDINGGTSTDFNHNAIPDKCDIAGGNSTDYDKNGIPDEADVFVDCNGNDVDDRIDIALGDSDDCNGNGIPDECDIDSTAVDYSTLVLQSNPVSYWQFNESAGSNSFGDSGSANLTMNEVTGENEYRNPYHDVWAGKPSMAGLGTSIETTHGYVAANDSGGNLALTTNYTWEFWVKVKYRGYGETYVALGNSTDQWTQPGNADYKGSHMKLKHRDGYTRLTLTGTSTSGGDRPEIAVHSDPPTFKLEDDTWYHMVVVVAENAADSSLNDYTGYVNWVDSDGNMHSAVRTSPGQKKPLAPTSDKRFSVGGMLITGSWDDDGRFLSRRLCGWIDEVAVYNTVLDAATIQSHFEAGITYPADSTDSNTNQIPDECE